MALSAFDDRAAPPTAESLARMLGPRRKLWERVQRNLQSSHGPLAEEWGYPGKALGWSFRLKERKRVLVSMTPCRGYFLCSIVLGERACAAAREAGLSKSVLARIDAAPRYAEGRGLRFPVRAQADAAAIEALAALKAAH